MEKLDSQLKIREGDLKIKDLEERFETVEAEIGQLKEKVERLE